MKHSFLPIRHTLMAFLAISLLTACEQRVSLPPTPSITPTVSPATVVAMVEADGRYTITSRELHWTFGGQVGQPVSNRAVHTGSDRVGPYNEITFHYQADGPRSGAIRVYTTKPVVLFTDTYLATANNGTPFPRLTIYPQNLYRLSYAGEFANYTFNSWSNESPELFFDGQQRGFLLSPASNFMIASLSRGSDGSISSGIQGAIRQLPAGFTHQTLLVIQQGIHALYETWGHAMTNLQGKTRPTNDASVVLNKLGYWTDNGAAYYYTFDRNRGYTGTLLAVRDSFKREGIPLGYIQLDSWWYPKGSAHTWYGDPKNDRGGIYTYTADPVLFPDGLQAFQQQLGLPLLTHARWIDPTSPYRKEYTMSNNVITDPRYWNATAAYLKQGGVIMYEQDWLNVNAVPATNLTDPTAFTDGMASAMAAQGITMQYCLALPRFYLQSTRYDNLTTMRVSIDRFQRAFWTPFLYTSQLTGALGAWPWSDVFMSTETDNLLLSTLSAGIVGVGDVIDAESKTNLFQTVRPDGVIVKPDIPIEPVGQMYITDAQGLDTPMIASTYSDHQGMRAAYVFAYRREKNQQVGFTPAELGLSGSVYVYNYFTGKGQVVENGSIYHDTVADASYYIVVPVGPSKIAFLGDAGKFVSLGQKRISQLSDNGVVKATVLFAQGEKMVTLHGYAPAAPTVTAASGSADLVSYDSTSHLFSVVVSPSVDGSALISLGL